MKPKREVKCVICGTMFVRWNSFQKVCTNPDCIIANSKKLKEKEHRKAIKEYKASDKATLIKLAQTLANKYGRLKDEKKYGKRCCTCGTTKGKMDGGHFLPTSTFSSIRFNTNQINQQCVKCNRYNSGMRSEYKEFMEKIYSKEYVSSLESKKGITRKYETEYLQRLISVLKKKIKKLT